MAPMAEYNDKLDIVTKEVVICKLLTSNDTKVRKRGLKSLKKWFSEIGLAEGVQEDDFNRIWNGLFYYVWMSDKPLVQEEAVEYISSLMHILKNYQASMYYIRGFFSSLVKQWDRISHHRIDKFLMFIRRFLRQILMLLKKHEWDIEKLELFSKELYNAVQILPYSLALHLNEIFNEEVAKISKGEIPTNSLVVLYKGYIECIVNLRPSMQIVNSIQSSIFCGLVRQLKLYIKQKVLTESCDNEDNDELGSKEKANTINSDSRHEDVEKLQTETCENEDSDSEEIALDPRPGGVDVFLPYIDFDEKMFVKFLEQYTSKTGIHIKAKNILNQISTMFASISKLRISKPDDFIHEMKEHPKKRKRQKTMSKLMKKACNRLEEDDELEAERDERVLKKLAGLTDLIQISAGKSTFTIAQAKPKNTATKRSSISNDWVVTETNEKPSPAKKVKISGSKSDWVVEPVSKDKEKTVPAIEQSELINKDDENENASDICLEILEESEKSIDKSSGEKSKNKSPKGKSIPVIEQSELINKDDETENPSDICLEILEENEKSKNKSPKAKTIPVIEQSELINKDNETEKPSDICLEILKESEKSKNKSPKVSFSEQPTVTIYENDKGKETGASDTESEIIVPSSVVKGHPKLMKKDRDYVVVDFKPETVVDEENEPDTKKISPKVTRTLRSRKVESTPAPVSTPDSKRTRKPREKKVEPASQRKSSRIAEKQKKVLFKLEDNTYQDIRTYEKVLKSKPASPFDVSKIPNCGILKPFAVTTPINPFYFANGERKLKRRRK